MPNTKSPASSLIKDQKLPAIPKEFGTRSNEAPRTQTRSQMYFRSEDKNKDSNKV